MILLPQDFIGEFSIPNENPFLQDNNLIFIEKKEKDYIKKLFGFSGYEEIKANLNSDKWQKIINGFSYIENGNKIEIQGLKEMLLGFVYFEIQKQTLNLVSSSGYVITEMENSKPLNAYDWQRKINEAYNYGLKIYNNLIVWLYQNNTFHVRVADSYIDNGDDTYTFLVDNTDFLLIKSLVRFINWYEIIDIEKDVKFTISEKSGKIFEKQFAFYDYGEISPYELRTKQIIKY